MPRKTEKRLFHQPILIGSLSLDYLWLWVQRGRLDECWEWLGERNSKGRGYIRVVDSEGKEIYLNAPRTIWGFVNGKDTMKGKTLHHRCGYRLCCNMRHIIPLPQKRA